MIFLHFQAALWIVFIAWFGFSAFSSAYISSIERGFSEKKGFSTFRLKPFSASGRALQTDKPAHFNIESPPPTPPSSSKIILSAGERGLHAEGQHNGEDHRLWYGQGARTWHSCQGALRDPGVCRS